MPILTLVPPDSPMLRKTRLVTADELSDDYFWTFVRFMKEFAAENKLLGLAANQVGADKRFFIMNMKAKNEEAQHNRYIGVEKPDYRLFVNPFVTVSIYGYAEEDWEACASLPNITAKVKRANLIKLDFYSRLAKIDYGDKLQLRGYLARIAQHEVDHLDGILITDIAKKIVKGYAE